MIKIWSSGTLSTENVIFFRTPTKEKAYLYYQGSKTELPTQDLGPSIQGEFRVSLPGEYKIFVGQESEVFQVKQYERFNFQYEIFFTVAAVLLFFFFLLRGRRVKNV